VRATGAALFSASHRLLAEMYLGMIFSRQGPGPVQLGPGKDEKTPQIVLVEILDRIEQIAVEGHQWPLGRREPLL
jgi:hypothetical protein